MNNEIVLIDSHAHIYYRDYAADFEEMLKRAADAGVGAMLVVGTDIESSRESVELAEKYPQLYASVGIHPHDASRVTEACYEAIRELALASPKVVAIGEIGLDFYRDRSPRDEQERVFRAFLRMARELDKPVIIHDRDAHERVMECLREERSDRGVLHCFSGDSAMAAEAIGMGFYISIPGTVTYPSNQGLRDVVAATSMDRMLVETDCPYLSPVPHRGKRNEPAYVVETARVLAEVKGASLDEITRQTTDNFFRLFAKVPRDTAAAA
jgi:TatD DNase family protein